MTENITTAPRCANPNLMRRTLAHIEAHPEGWNQREWATPRGEHGCGTAYCFAGHAVALAGGRIDVSTYSVDIASLPEDARGRLMPPPDWTTTYIRDAAVAVLGIDDVDASALFAARNTLDDLRYYVAELTAEGDSR